MRLNTAYNTSFTRWRIRKTFLLSVLLGCITWSSYAGQKTRILFLVDASLSMRNQWPGGTKWYSAMSTLNEIMDSISALPNLEVGLRVFGSMSSEPEKNCYDSRLEVPIDSGNLEKIRQKLAGIKPKGITPLVYAIEKSANDFGTQPAKNILIVVTDGEDVCGGDPCAVSLTLQKNNVVLRPFIIGLQLQPESVNKLDCIGKLFNTRSADDFEATMKRVVLESISKTTVQVNLNDTNGKPTETDVDMTFYDEETGIAKYDFYHTLNSRGLPDTLVISPMFHYRVQVHTVPPLELDSIVLQKNHHNIINLNAAQGYLHFALQGKLPPAVNLSRIKCLVHLPSNEKTLYVQRPNTSEKYLIGKYDLEILTLPRILLKDVVIGQSKTTDVFVPAPGLVSIDKSVAIYGSIFISDENELKKIYDLDSSGNRETVALQPGKYQVVYRAKNSKSIHSTVEKEFVVTSGGTVSLEL